MPNQTARRPIVLAACVAGLLQSPAISATAVPWLDLSTQRTPVHRPIAELAAQLNARGCTSGLHSTVSLRDVEGQGLSALWRVERVDDTPRPKTWAVLRTLLPELGRRVPNKSIGVRVCPQQPASLTFEVFADANPRDGFYRPARSLGQSKPRTVPVGGQDLDLLWSQAGVSGERLARVNAYGLVCRTVPASIAVSRVDLLFATDADADEFRRQRAARLRTLQAAMVSALKARGVDLMSLAKRVAPNDLEPRIWQGVQL